MKAIDWASRKVRNQLRSESSCTRLLTLSTTPCLPLEEYRLSNKIPKLPLEDQSPKYLVVAEYDVYKRLSHLNAAKAGGPDGIPDWILREYAEFLAYPV